MSSGNFDRDSAARISRAVRYIEGSWPVGTKRERRPGLPDASGELQIVRLIENVPGASLYSTNDDFYDRLRLALEARPANTLSTSELLSIGSDIIERFTDDINADPAIYTVLERFFGSGLAYLCSFEPGRNREALQEGAVSNVIVRFTAVVRVWNMHPRGYNTADIGGVFGNEAGSLGAGYCNCIRGWDGELWLVSPDRRLQYLIENDITTLRANVDAVDGLLNRFITWVFGPLGPPF